MLPVPAREAQALVDERNDSGRKGKAYNDQGDDGQPWILQKSMHRFHTQSSLELRSLHNTRITLKRKGYESVRYNSEKFMETKPESFAKRQLLPLSLTIVAFAVLTVLLYLEIRVLNHFTVEDIALKINPLDVIIGLTIYLKTAIDFAIFIGNLMHKNPGMKGRISIELGSALGNAAGTMAILLIWTFFKEIRWLLVIMLFLAAIVLFKLAEDSLEHAHNAENHPKWFNFIVRKLEKALHYFNILTHPLLRRILPHGGMKAAAFTSFWGLFAFAFTVPFILGLDDFAGYVPLFSIINVFGFGIGVFLGHMVLNILLYINPEKTIKLVKLPAIALIGAIAFVVLGFYGFYEIAHLIGH